MAPLLALLLASLLSLSTAAGLGELMRQSSTNLVATVMAAQANTVGKAYARYLSDQSSSIALIATANVPATISQQMLIDAGYLPASVAISNSFRQQWQMQVLQPTPGALLSLVTSTGGREISDQTQLTKIAAQASGKGILGGFVPYPNQDADPTMQANVAVGAGGSFRQSLAGFANPGSGHIAMLLSMSGAAADNGYLYRVSVPNRPDLNQMQTALGMGGNDINGARTVNGQSFSMPNGASFKGDQGGSLEIGNVDGSTPGAAPYIDFHAGGVGVQDFNMRLMNDRDNHLVVVGANGGGELEVRGNVTTPSLNLNSASGSCTWNDVSIRSNKFYLCNASGRWVEGSSLIGNQTSTGYYQGWYNGWGVNVPQCGPGGGAWWQITPITTGVDFANHNPPLSGAVYTMGWNGSQWVLQIFNVLADGNRTRISDELGLQADIRVGCNFNNGA
ncbi:shufflon system plasmid conjugative transfer pilus tip adhesin PilV [Burkholderia cenocepacia]|uniref:shufflon system plasmid conjugative transfer pilus tip adhesin PilV n=1 Tax=Burkholderia cenocepacia TaxID=95486 RepID=UPI002230CAFB|nr:shufflon system plasmid conjugative transfer pilus tip adhesin PilV [Burkholderia cenocepacia]MCW3677826.1 shufflon system plasmid conjugative transfer pilus tip adhesin PilV [Burkholderia cenocepacia]